MKKRDDGLPESPVPGLIPTLNNTGWMTESLDAMSTDFARHAGTLEDEVLDIGCAYGIATMAALESGARVVACDIEPKHLEILADRVPEGWRDRLRCQAGAMPGVDFPANSFGALLAARVLHFLNGDEVTATIRKMYQWLRPGGRAYLVADSPYVGPWRDRAPEYERRKAAGDPWPAFYDDYVRFLPPGTPQSEHPDYINPMDPDVLSRVCEEAGFEILEAKFLRGGTPNSSDRDHAGVTAVKPG